MDYVLKIPAVFRNSIPLADVIEMLAQVEARGGDGTQPLHLPNLENTRRRALNRLQRDFDTGLLRATDGEDEHVISFDVRYRLVDWPTLRAWAIRHGDSVDIQIIDADHQVETDDLRGTVWGPAYADASITNGPLSETPSGTRHVLNKRPAILSAEIAKAQSTAPDVDMLERTKPLQKLRAQENMIVEWLMKSGHTPKKLPPLQKGKPGVKNVCYTALKSHELFSSQKKFGSTWERLSADKTIGYEKEVSPLQITQ